MLQLKSISASFAKKLTASVVLIGVGVLAIASMGGGGSKAKDKSVKPEFTPIRTSSGFTLKAGPSYHGSMIFAQEKTKNLVSYSSVVTYQKGNTIYILPCRYKLQTGTAQSGSLQMFNLKIKMHK